MDYWTGMIVETAGGRLAFARGTMLDSHAELLKAVKKIHGEVPRILWAGEMQASVDGIEVVNETAGILVREPELSVDASIANFQTYLVATPGLRIALSPRLRLKTYRPDDEHLNPSGKGYFAIRHDMRNALMMIYYLLDEPRELESEYRMLRNAGEKVLCALQAFRELSVEIEPTLFERTERLTRDGELPGEAKAYLYQLAEFETRLKNRVPQVDLFLID